jgi:hypothetical protein
MSANLCRHIKTNGQRCKSPSLGLLAFCYFHSRLHRRHKELLKSSSALAVAHPKPTLSTPEEPQSAPDYATQNPIELDLPPVEDAESIQVSISLLIAALARNRIDPKRAAVLLYGLQLASSNAKSIITEPYTSSVIRSVARTKSGRDLATRESQVSGKNTAPRPSKPAPAPQEDPVNLNYNENL